MRPFFLHIPSLYSLPSLDSIGIAGFGHDFHSLDGHRSPVADVFDSFGTEDTSLFSHFVFLLGPVLPMPLNLPTERNKTMKRLNATMTDIADVLLEGMRKEREAEAGAAVGGGVQEKSEEKLIIWLLSGFLCGVFSVRVGD